MSLAPQDEPDVVVQHTALVPTVATDARSHWRKFADAIRQFVGLKPLYLAERFATAKVRQQEIDVDVKLLAARAQYELACAQAKQIELLALGQHAKDTAVAGFIENLNCKMADSSLVQKVLDGQTQTASEAMSYVESIVQQIRLHGGAVELTFDSATSAEDSLPD